MPSSGAKGVAVVSEIEWPEEVGGMAVGGFHAHADLLMEGRLQPAAQLHTASHSSQPAQPASLGRLAAKV